MKDANSKHRGDLMKRLIVWVVMSAMAVTLFSPTVGALQWDPDKPSPESIIRETRGARPQGDDTPWGEMQKSDGAPGDWISLGGGCWFLYSRLVSRLFGLLDTGHNGADKSSLDDAPPFSSQRGAHASE